MDRHEKKSSGKHAEPNRTLRVLLVEDSEADAALMVRALERGGFDAVCMRVEDSAAMRTALHSHTWDLVLADHSMPEFSAPEALTLLQQRGVDIPFIIVSGHIDEHIAVTAMRAGAHDYVMKDRLARLVPAVERELREAEVRRARTKSEEQLRKAHEELEVRVQQRTADLQAANQKLQDVIEQRKRLEHELLEIAENERRRIGFDLHDDLGQKLAGVSLLIKALEQKLIAQQNPCVEVASKVQGLMEEISQHTHNLARHFSSLDLQGDDLATVLQGLSGHVEKMFDVTCGCVLKGEIPPLPHHTTMQLYKISQEAVSNSIKHGKAKHVSVAVALRSSDLVVTIKNDGLPFIPPANVNKRMGLRIMNFRANTIGATLDIKPQEKGGTIVTCTLPLKAEAKAPRS